MATSDEAKLAGRYVGELAATRQTLALFEPVQAALHLDPPKEFLLLLTGLRIVLMRRKAGIQFRSPIHKWFHLLDLDSLERHNDHCTLTLGFRTAKEMEVVKVVSDLPSQIIRIVAILHESLQLIAIVRQPMFQTGIVLPPRSNAPKDTVAAVTTLYLAICDRDGQIPSTIFLEYLAAKQGPILSLPRAVAGDVQGIVRPLLSDFRPICDCLRNQDIFSRMVILENLSLADDCLDSIMEVAFSPFNSFTRLYCAGSNWGKSAQKNLANCLLNVSRISPSRLAMKQVVLYNQNLGDDGIEELIKAIRETKLPANTLLLSNCSMTSRGVVTACSLLVDPHFHDPTSGLISLDLSRNDLSRQCAISLGQFLSQTTVLRRLSLALTGVDLQPILQSISQNSRLAHTRMEVLNLSGLKISKDSALLLRSILGQTKTLTHVILERTKIDEVLLAAIFDAIANNTSGCQFVLSMACSSLGSIFSKCTGDSIRRHGPLTNISVLGLSYNQFNSVEQLKELVEVLEKVPSLRHLSFDGNIEVPKLLQHKKKSKELGDLVARLLNSLPKLESFSLAADEQHFMGDGIISVLEAITNHSSLKSLDLTSNRLSEKGFAALATMLSRNKVLVRLDVDMNAVKSGSLMEMSAAIKSNSECALRHVEMRQTLADISNKRVTRRIHSMALFARELSSRLKSNEKSGIPIPASMNCRLARIQFIEELYHEIFEEFNLVATLDGIVNAFSAELTRELPSSRSTASRLKNSLSSAITGTSSNSEMVFLRNSEMALASGTLYTASTNGQFAVTLKSMEMLATEPIQKYYPSGVPAVLIQMDLCLDDMKAQESVGIFRLAPDETDSKVVKKQLNEGIFRTCSDVNSVANNLKVWYRDMPDKLLSDVSMEDLQACTTADSAGQIIAKVTEPFRSLLLWTLDVFVKYDRSSEKSKMTAHNLAIVFSPNFYTTSMSDPMAGMMAFQQVSRVAELLIEHRAKSFDEGALRATHREWIKRYCPEDIEEESEGISMDEATETKSCSELLPKDFILHPVADGPQSNQFVQSRVQATENGFGAAIVSGTPTASIKPFLSTTNPPPELRTADQSLKGIHRRSTRSEIRAADPDSLDSSNQLAPHSCTIQLGANLSLMQEMQQVKLKKTERKKDSSTPIFSIEKSAADEPPAKQPNQG